MVPADCVEILAVWMLHMGHVFGWRRMLSAWHSVSTMKKYDRMLDIDSKDRFQEVAEHLARSLGFRVASTLSNFWRLVRGVDHVEGAKDARIE